MNVADKYVIIPTYMSGSVRVRVHVTYSFAIDQSWTRDTM